MPSLVLAQQPWALKDGVHPTPEEAKLAPSPLTLFPPLSPRMLPAPLPHLQPSLWQPLPRP